MYFIATYGVSEGATASTEQNLEAAGADVLLFLSAIAKILYVILFLYPGCVEMHSLKK